MEFAIIILTYKKDLRCLHNKNALINPSYPATSYKHEIVRLTMSINTSPSKIAETSCPQAPLLASSTRTVEGRTADPSPSQSSVTEYGATLGRWRRAEPKYEASSAFNDPRNVAAVSHRARLRRRKGYKIDRERRYGLQIATASLASALQLP